MEYLIQNWLELLIMLLIGSGFGYICCGLFAGGSIVELENMNVLLEGRNHELEQTNKELQHQLETLKKAKVV